MRTSELSKLTSYKTNFLSLIPYLSVALYFNSIQYNLFYFTCRIKHCKIQNKSNNDNEKIDQ